jgi:hypothetical protein
MDGVPVSVGADEIVSARIDGERAASRKLAAAVETERGASQLGGDEEGEGSSGQNRHD